MISGYFRPRGTRLRPFVRAALQLPSLQGRVFELELLVDTGADRTILAPAAAVRLSGRYGLDLTSLPRGVPTAGVGGRAATRTIEAVVVLGSFESRVLSLPVLEPPTASTPSIPSLLGRDLFAHFALFLEERTQRMLLLEPHEVDALPLP
jgi:hypothetical protein